MSRRLLGVFILVVMFFGFGTNAFAGKADGEDFIKWMDFDVPLEVLKQAYDYDVESQNSDVPLDFVQLLSYAAAKNWGNFKGRGPSAAMDDVVKRIRGGETMHEIAQDMELYQFYLTAYQVVLGGFVGEYEVEVADENDPENIIWERRYGLRAFSPMAKGYSFSHSDDFGNPRSYGYRRPHLGHDLFGSVGAPIIAVEGGVVEATGWNQYGGWRIGIRTLDGKRYYYYAHLRKDKPYVEGLEVGQRVNAGDVIGYLGQTGYSRRENVNNIREPHLHFGMQIIFDESQKDGRNQIWIDAYSIVRFLNKNRMEVFRDENGEYHRTIKINNMPME
ncbi:MAG: M23 family metallopeptidase [Defluviitaleaceae bacterium]|nr:M23 family metallopeptidase [Defluviitaleaceae bacterium]